MNDRFDELEAARIKAMRLLSYGPRSKAELYKRLRGAQFGEEAVEAVVAEMVALNYVNDKKTAENYVAYAIESLAHGRDRIIRDLRRKGIARELTEQAYAEYVASRRHESGDDEYDPEFENAVNALSARVDQTGLDPDDLDAGDVRRLTGYLARRGFSFSIINQAFRAIRE